MSLSSPADGHSYSGDRNDNNDDVRPMNDTTMPPPPPRPKALVGQPTTSTAAVEKKVAAIQPRNNKKALRKGFGLHDWALLTRTAKDLAQRRGAPLRSITKEEVAQHNQEYDGWCSLKGKVYNVGPYLPYHPGGIKIMHKVLGKDATALFEKYHPWVNIDGLIGTLQIGYLTMGKSDDDDNEKLPIYLAQQEKKNEFAIPAPIITETKAKDINNVLPKPIDKTEDIEEDYKEPWE